MTLAWHFTKTDYLGNGDGRRIRVGHALVHRGKLEMCVSGLHCSQRIVDALAYAPGPTCWRVEAGGNVIEGEDKIVCSRRKAIWRVDAEPVLCRFARWCALGVVHLWSPSSVVMEYLTTGNAGIRDAARDAAWAAARDAAWDAAWYAAWDATLDATLYAAWDAAWDAADTAARAASRDAASAAARAAVDTAAGTAAGTAARAAAWAAARDIQNAELERLLTAAHEGTLGCNSPLEPHRSFE